MRYVGYVKTDDSQDPTSFEFEVANDVTEEDIAIAAEAALWESGVLDFWWKKGGESVD